MSLLLLVLALTPVVIWAVRSSESETDEPPGKNDVLFQKLDTAQILGKIASK